MREARDMNSKRLSSILFANYVLMSIYVRTENKNCIFLFKALTLHYLCKSN